MNFQGVFVTILVQIAYEIAAEQMPRHGSDILHRPDDVIGTKCGDTVELSCVARSTSIKTVEPEFVSSLPEIEWWSKTFDDKKSDHVLEKMVESGEVEIKVEVLKVVRSTLVIKNIKKSDEGIYQCRASSNEKRNNPDINFYQYWAIEEAPIKNLVCPKSENSTENNKKSDDNLTKRSNLSVKKGNELMENKNDFEKTTNSENSTEIIYLDDFESIKLKEHENNKKLRLQNSSSETFEIDFEPSNKPSASAAYSSSGFRNETAAKWISQFLLVTLLLLTWN